jgi:hypothetical protein
MTQADDQLRALFAQDEPPARDAAFSMAVMEGLMRRRFQEDVALLCGVSVVGGAVLWPLWPVLQPALATLSQGLVPVLGVVALGACALVVLGGRARSALGLS